MASSHQELDNLLTLTRYNNLAPSDKEKMAAELKLTTETLNKILNKTLSPQQPIPYVKTDNDHAITVVGKKICDLKFLNLDDIINANSYYQEFNSQIAKIVASLKVAAEDKLQAHLALNKQNAEKIRKQADEILDLIKELKIKKNKFLSAVKNYPSPHQHKEKVAAFEAELEKLHTKHSLISELIYRADKEIIAAHKKLIDPAIKLFDDLTPKLIEVENSFNAVVSSYRNLLHYKVDPNNKPNDSKSAPAPTAFPTHELAPAAKSESRSPALVTKKENQHQAHGLEEVEGAPPAQHKVDHFKSSPTLPSPKTNQQVSANVYVFYPTVNLGAPVKVSNPTLAPAAQTPKPA